MQKIITHLWFDDQAEAAAKFYTSLFRNSRIGRTTRYPENVAGMIGMRAGSVMTVEFELDGQLFYALNAGPTFKFNESISLFVNCENQAEIDALWNRLLEGGQAQQCGWLKDKYGLSWQIVPTVLGEMQHDPDPEKVSRVMGAMMRMIKLDIKALQQAYDGAK